MRDSNATVPTARRPVARRANFALEKYTPYTSLSFSHIDQHAKSFANLIESRFDALANILLTYESYEVVEDETARTLDLLRSLKENSKYFRLRVNEITAFLPRNQPLYAFTLLVIVPSLMASKVHFRIPHSMRHFFPRVLSLLDVHTLFPNIVVSNHTRLEFLRERSALRINPATEETLPVTDVVIFTGTPAHADQLRLIFDNRTLFIANGAGHNPIIVSHDAAVSKTVDAVLTLQLYNQGQDCAAPNAILVHKNVFPTFLNLLRDKLRTVRVGHYHDKSCRVGPISDPKDLVRIQDFLIHHRAWLDLTTPGIIRAHDAIVEPTIISKPLKEGGNFTEIFAPVIFVQEYENDPDLALYFENPHYAQNAMYISLYGTSAYVESLIDRSFEGKVLHDKASVLRNTHLHANGIERGTQPYGGNGHGASSLTINGNTVCKPTLPQRDIYECVAKPLLHRKSLDKFRRNLRLFTTMYHKNVEKVLRLLYQESRTQNEFPVTHATYMDTHTIKQIEGRRYAKIDEKCAYHLLERPNIGHVSRLHLADLKQIRALRSLLSRRSGYSLEEFTTLLYSLSKKPESSEQENHARQRLFFQHVYQLLFGKKFGPRLPQFLLDVELRKVKELLDV